MTQHLFKTTKRLLNIQLATLINLKIYGITMDRLQRTNIIPTSTLFFLFLLVTAPSLIFAKGVSKEVPENSTAKSYGGGWSCNKGYRESKGACAEVKVPANAYPTNKTYGQGWECKRGFQEVNNTCNHIKVPKNGYLDYSGIRVECDRGYLMVNKTCEAIKVPVNGYLEKSSYGPGWTCERGYRADKDDCVALSMPENSYIGYSGNAWECNKPYIKKRGSCYLSVKN